MALRGRPGQLNGESPICCGSACGGLEALQNSAKQARSASEVTIRLADDERLLHFYVADDGAGFLFHRAAGGSGLTNMRDRLGAVGGRAWIDSAPGRGTVVHGQFPVTGKGDPPELLTEREIRVLRLLRGVTTAARDRRRTLAVAEHDQVYTRSSAPARRLHRDDAITRGQETGIRWTLRRAAARGRSG